MKISYRAGIWFLTAVACAVCWGMTLAVTYHFTFS